MRKLTRSYSINRSRLLFDARRMRAAPTRSEEIAWRFLRGACAELGLEVRRQVPIGRFIVDFLVPSLRLVIEIDGSAHARKASADARRTLKLERAGYRVLRLRASSLERRTP